MTRFMSISILVSSLLALSACEPNELTLQLPDGTTGKMTFYPGGTKLDDLLIISGTNYFGKAQYQIDDPLSDIGFRFNSGERVQAECISKGPNIIGEDECKIYQVYRSSFSSIPEGTKVPRPN